MHGEVDYKSSGLTKQVLAGGALTVGSLLDNALRFGRNAILARLLMPESFGIMAMVIAVVAAAEAFTEVGLKQSVIQNKKGEDEEFLNAVFWISSLRGLGLYVIAALLSPLICDFFRKPEAVNILRVGFLVLIFTGCQNPRVYVLEKQLRFKRWVILMQTAGIAGVIVSVAGAFVWNDIRALILGYLTEFFVRTGVSYVAYPFRPLFKINRECLREISTFSKRIFGLPVLMILFVQADTFIVGRVLSLGVLGMYGLTRDLADIPNKVFTRIGPIFLPTFSIIQDESDRLLRLLTSIMKVLGTFGIPFFATIMLFSRETLELAYGFKDSSLVLPFNILCVYCLVMISSSINMNIYIALGEPQIQRTAAVVRTASFLLMIYPMTKGLGLIGAASSCVFAAGCGFIVQLIYLNRLLKLSMAKYLSCFLDGLLLTLVIVVPVVVLKLYGGINRQLLIVIGGFLCIGAWFWGAQRLGYVQSLLTARKNYKTSGKGGICAAFRDVI